MLTPYRLAIAALVLIGIVSAALGGVTGWRMAGSAYPSAPSTIVIIVRQ